MKRNISFIICAVGILLTLAASQTPDLLCQEEGIVCVNCHLIGTCISNSSAPNSFSVENATECTGESMFCDDSSATAYGKCARYNPINSACVCHGDLSCIEDPNNENVFIKCEDPDYNTTGEAFYCDHDKVLLDSCTCSSNPVIDPSSSTSSEIPPTSTSSEIPPTSTLSEIPPTSTSSKIPPTSTSSEIPPTSTSSEIPPTSTSSEIPSTSTSSEMPPTSTSSEVPPTSKSSEIPPTSTLSEIPPTSTSSEIPPTSTSSEIPPTSTSSEIPSTSKSSDIPPTSTSSEIPQTSTSSEVPPTSSEIFPTSSEIFPTSTETSSTISDKSTAEATTTTITTTTTTTATTTVIPCPENCPFVVDPNGEDCTKFLACIDGENVPGQCPSDFCFDQVLCQCTPTYTTTPISCPDGCRFVKDPSDNCTKYFLCSSDENIPYNCPSSKCFDQTSCGCVEQISTLTTTTTTTTTTPTPTITISTPMMTTTTTTSTTQGPPTCPPGCPFVDDPSGGCGNFFICNDGILIPSECPGTLCFDQDACECD